ncbi:MAG: hypothetical protein DI585_06545, partial [Pseudomonas fluorescens]
MNTKKRRPLRGAVSVVIDSVAQGHNRIFAGEGYTRRRQRTKGLLLKTAASEGFKGKNEQTFVFQTHGKVGAQRVILLGLGAR